MTRGSPELTAGMVPDDFTVSVTNGPVPGIVSVSPNDQDVTVQLDGPIPAGQWTRIRHNCSGTSACLGFLPADVNQDGTTSPADILGIIDCLNGVAVFPCNLWNTDIDRSGEMGAPDILRVIDLLNGAGVYDSWFAATLPPNPCTFGSGSDKDPISDEIPGAGLDQYDPDAADSFVALVTTDVWTQGLPAPDIEVTVDSFVDYLIEVVPEQDRWTLATQLPTLEIPNPVVAAMIPEVVSRLLQASGTAAKQGD